MPAIFSATVFASPMWPSSRWTKTGLSGVTASISARVGSALSGHDSWSQKPPRIQRPFGCVFT